MNEIIRKNAELIAMIVAFGLLYGTWELTQWTEGIYGKLPLEGADVLAEKPKVSSSGLEGLFPVLIAGAETVKPGAVDLGAIESAFRVKVIQPAKAEAVKPDAVDAPVVVKPPTCAEQIKPRISVDAFTSTSVVISGAVLRKGESLNLPTIGALPTISDWDASKGTVVISCGKERIVVTAVQ